MKTLVYALALLWALTATAFAAQTLDAASAYQQMSAGKMVLVDVRTEKEWRATGVAPGAVTLTMGSSGFAEKLKALVDANPGKTIGLICASGGRSTSVQRQLAKAGITNTVDIAEGMKGTLFSPGWIGRGLPVRPYN
jgi:rhodanese-related sulfurtransferase